MFLQRLVWAVKSMCFSAVLLFTIASAVEGLVDQASIDYDAKQKAFGKKLDCIRQEGDYTGFWEQVKTARSSDRDLSVVVHDICRKIPKAFSCVDELWEIARTLNPPNVTEVEDRFSIAILREYHSLERYLCEDGGRKMVSFVESGGIECSEQSSDDVQRGCSELFSNMNKVMLPGFRAESYDSTIALHCGYLKSTQACISNVLKRHCAKKEVPSLVDGLFTSLLMRQPCGNSSSLALQAPFLVAISAALFMAIQVMLI